MDRDDTGSPGDESFVWRLFIPSEITGKQCDSHAALRQVRRRWTDLFIIACVSILVVVARTRFEALPLLLFSITCR